MSVIKPALGFERSIRPFAFAAGDTGSPAAATETPVEDPAAPVAQEDERLVLARRIAELEQALQEAARKAENDIAGALEKGREEGRARAETREAERVALLEQALIDARAETLAKLDADRAIAVEIARAALAQILGDNSSFAALVSETAVRWKDRLAATAIHRLHVSREDFADDQALQRLQARMGALAIDADNDLAPGSCIFELELGEVDASIPLQSARADELLGDYVRQGMAA